MAIAELTDHPASEAAWLRTLVLRAFLLRAALAVVLHALGLSSTLAPDEGTYEYGGNLLAQSWQGELILLGRPAQLGHALAYYYLNGFSLFLFGSVVPLKILNALVGAMACRVAYGIARPLYGSRVAQLTALFTAYLPSLALWSALNIRDVWVLLLILLITSASLRLVAAYSHRSLLVMVASLYAITWFRQYLFFALALPPLLAFVVGRRGSFGRGFAVAAVLGTIIIILVQQGSAQQAMQLADLETLSEVRRDLARGAGSAFEADRDISTPAKAIQFLPIGIAYFLFSPFPWQMTSALKLLSLPEMLVLYWLMPRIFSGLRTIVRQHFRSSLQILFLSAFLTVSYALGSGNVGTLYRHRAQVVVFYLIFAAVGIEARRQTRTPEPLAPTP